MTWNTNSRMTIGSGIPSSHNSSGFMTSPLRPRLPNAVLGTQFHLRLGPRNEAPERLKTVTRCEPVLSQPELFGHRSALFGAIVVPWLAGDDGPGVAPVGRPQRVAQGRQPAGA